MTVGNRRYLAEDFVGQDFRLLPTLIFDVQGIPGHQNIGDQRQRARDGRQLVFSTARLGPRLPLWIVRSMKCTEATACEDVFFLCLYNRNQAV